MKILIYALGGGWGHLSRAVALANALKPLSARVLTNSPYAGIVQAAMPELAIELLATREQAVSEIADSNPDILVVDAFPRGLGGELASVLPRCRRAKKVLIHRDISPAYVAWAGNLREFVANQYDCIVCPGEAGPFSDLPNAHDTQPWIVRAPREVSQPARAIVCASGNEDERAWHGEVAALLIARGVDLRCLAPELPAGCPPPAWIRYWPAIDWIASARVVIGGAGYNTINECALTGTPLVAHPWPRKYDRQRERAQRSSRVTIVETPIEAANAALGLLNGPPPARREFRNGACEAANLIRELFT